MCPAAATAAQLVLISHAQTVRYLHPYEAALALSFRAITVIITSPNGVVGIYPTPTFPTMSAQSRSPSPKRQPTQQNRKIGGIAGLSSPKFSFRAALVQHKASKLASKPQASSNDTLSTATQGDHAKPTQEKISLNSASHDSKISRPIRSIATSSIPSLSARTRLNSTSSDVASTSTLPRRREAGSSPETSRASSSLGKRPMEEAATIAGGDHSSMSDFGPIMRPKGANASITGAHKGVASTSARGATKTSKLPGPPSARSQWSSSASLKSLPSPSTAKAPRKIARSDSVAEVHAATPSTTTASPAEPRIGGVGSVRSRTISATARPIPSTQQRPKIGTLPKPKPRAVPVRTLLDERPSGLLGDDNPDASDSDDDEDEDDDDEDALEGPDVSRIRTKRTARKSTDENMTAQPPAPVQSKMPPPVAVTATTGSRIPSIGSTGARATSRLHRRSSSNSIGLAAAVGEKENLSHVSNTMQSSTASKRHSVGGAFGTQARIRSSLPLAAVTQPANHQPPATATVSDDDQATSASQSPASSDTPLSTQPPQPKATTPTSPAKSTSLSALRSRGLQSDSAGTAKNANASTDSSLPSRSSRQDFGIKASIISANPIHPSILALQAKTVQHQPISTPEALIKAKKRLSGALLTSSSSSSTLSGVPSTASPSERASSLARSTSVHRMGSLKKMHSTPRSGIKPLESATAATPSTSAATLPRSGSRSPIKSSLLLFPTGPSDGPQHAMPKVMSPAVRELALSGGVRGTPNSALRQRNRVLSSSEIDANLLASLKVVAQKANLQVRDLLDEEKRAQQVQQEHHSLNPVSDPSHEEVDAKGQERARREASEELEALAGDVSVDLMALDLAAGSPSSDVSMLRSPPLSQGAYLDTPPSVLAAMAAHPQVEDEDERSHIDDDATDTSCGSPSVRAAALRLPRGHAFQTETVETPVRRGYRNVPSIPSTPFPNCAASSAKSARAYPPSTGMSAKTRSRLKKALRESLGLEAHFATINLSSASGASAAPHRATSSTDGEERNENEATQGPNLRESISAMLLTDDDAYLDELVSAVARIGLEDGPSDAVKPAQNPAQSTLVSPSPAQPVTELDALPTPTDAAADPNLHSQLSTALAELAALRSALASSQTATAELETQLAAQVASSARTQRTQALLEADVSALRAELAGCEWEKAKTAWGRARVEALAELEEAKVQSDAMLVLDSQLHMWERMLRALVQA